ncbi:MAG: hypothetical protein ACU837_10085 [Gammaproteobacteria bacterium]
MFVDGRVTKNPSQASGFDGPAGERLSFGLESAFYDDQPSREVLAASVELTPVQLTSNEFKQLLEFLRALTDPHSLDLRNAAPARVPSGLPVRNKIAAPLRSLLLPFQSRCNR